MILLALLLIAAGIFMTMKPQLIWAISESWKSNDGTEPSDFYIWTIRAAGVVCTLIGVANAALYFAQ